MGGPQETNLPTICCWAQILCPSCGLYEGSSPVLQKVSGVTSLYHIIHNADCPRPRDYEYRLKKWNHRQKLTESGWQWVGNILDQRAAEGKHSQVLLSGVQIPVDKVLQRRRFHRRPTLAERYSSGTASVSIYFIVFATITLLTRPEIVPLRQPEDMPVRIRTPPPLEVYQVPWPGELPWVQFNKQLGGTVTRL